VGVPVGAGQLADDRDGLALPDRLGTGVDGELGQALELDGAQALLVGDPDLVPVDGGVVVIGRVALAVPVDGVTTDVVRGRVPVGQVRGRVDVHGARAGGGRGRDGSAAGPDVLHEAVVGRADGGQPERQVQPGVVQVEADRVLEREAARYADAPGCAHHDRLAVVDLYVGEGQVQRIRLAVVVVGLCGRDGEGGQSEGAGDGGQSGTASHGSPSGHCTSTKSATERAAEVVVAPA
jgi:hypothetical protein